MTVNLLLVEGGLYWLLKRGNFFTRTPSHLRLRLLQAGYLLTGLALLIFPALLIARLLGASSVEWGTRRRGRMVTARLRRELRRALGEVQQSRSSEEGASHPASE